MSQIRTKFDVVTRGDRRVPCGTHTRVNKTVNPDTETRPRLVAFCPRRARDLPIFSRDRDETETPLKGSRPSVPHGTNFYYYFYPPAQSRGREN